MPCHYRASSLLGSDFDLSSCRSIIESALGWIGSIVVGALLAIGVVAWLLGAFNHW